MSVDQIAKNKNEFLDKFNQLNSRIEMALGLQDFERAMKIDILAGKCYTSSPAMWFLMVTRCSLIRWKNVLLITPEPSHANHI